MEDKERLIAEATITGMVSDIIIINTKLHDVYKTIEKLQSTMIAICNIPVVKEQIREMIESNVPLQESVEPEELETIEELKAKLPIITQKIKEKKK